MKNKKIICRCKEITEEEIIEVIKKGIRDIDGIKRALGAGMGLCQGKTCTNLIIRIINRETGIPIEKIRQQTSRAPVRPIQIKIISD
ncbi:MAG: (2Fe-2S)-binding protein [Candidatus Omnitrophica bacterium]|nr:(2Fe-2S)-binding protein [Candidatus Omnitrophota bacterium]MCM8803236.1 (2Fe-2S)-binding protein [Candidatus Omnitrophota bacterium]